ncbi:MAG: type 1 glutamine amidotransferase domain-containing protein [Acidobacteriota bacterium]
MSANVDILNPDQPKRILMIVANPGINPRTGWPVGFWWSELTHPYLEFIERGYEVEVASPRGGDLQADGWSDPRDESGYSADDFVSLGFLSSPHHAGLLRDTRPVAEVGFESFDAIFVVGGQSPMVTMFDDGDLHTFLAGAYAAGKVLACVCHATCTLLKTRLGTGELLVHGKTWTGFANSEEQSADAFVGQKIQPFWIEDEARKLDGTRFIVHSAFKPHAVRDGRLVTGQQQYSGRAAAQLVIEALGI